LRNVLIAIGNSGEPSLAAAAERLLGDSAPLVRGAAVWALGRLDAVRLAHCANRYRAGESDADVMDEWSAALSGAGETHR
jgi:epoxyqueuosine reductase